MFANVDMVFTLSLAIRISRTANQKQSITYLLPRSCPARTNYPTDLLTSKCQETFNTSNKPSACPQRRYHNYIMVNSKVIVNLLTALACPAHVVGASFQKGERGDAKAAADAAAAESATLVLSQDVTVDTIRKAADAAHKCGLSGLNAEITKRLAGKPEGVPFQEDWRAEYERRYKLMWFTPSFAQFMKVQDFTRDALWAIEDFQEMRATEDAPTSSEDATEDAPTLADQVAKIIETAASASASASSASDSASSDAAARAFTAVADAFHQIASKIDQRTFWRPGGQSIWQTVSGPPTDLQSSGESFDDDGATTAAPSPPFSSHSVSRVANSIDPAPASSSSSNVGPVVSSVVPLGSVAAPLRSSFRRGGSKYSPDKVVDRKDGCATQ
jgi:hypothetical protein